MKTKRWNIARVEIWWCWGWLNVMCREDEIDGVLLLEDAIVRGGPG
jgi:hypothetical protein